MSIALDQQHVGSHANSATGSTCAVTTTATVASGGRLFGCVYINDTSTVSSVSDNGPGLTWSVAASASQSGIGVFLVTAYAPAGMASGTVITVTASASTPLIAAGFSSFTGTASSSPLDGTPVTSTLASPGSLSWSVGPLTTTNANDVLISVAGQSNSGGPSNTPGGSFLDLWGGSSDKINIAGITGLAMEYQIVSATGSYSATGTWSAGSGMKQSMLIAAFKQAAGTHYGPFTGNLAMVEDIVVEWAGSAGSMLLIGVG